jgi:hypothetical protein
MMVTAKPVIHPQKYNNMQCVVELKALFIHQIQFYSDAV